MALMNCPECGNEVSEKAITCPNCGVRIGNGHSKRANKLVITVLLIFAACCSLAAFYIIIHPEVINGDTTSEMIQGTEEKPLVFGVGDTAEYKNILVTLLNIKESNGNDFYKPESGNVFVYPEFEFVNNSNEDLTISSLITFDSYQDDYSTNISLQAEIVNAGETLDGTIAPGKKLKGTIGYELPSDYKKLEINISIDTLSNEKLVFIYNK